jgi:protein-arginine kinase activator protein McsA
MLCEVCKKEPAVVHITRIDADSGETAKHDFCVKCAEQKEGGKLPQRVPWVGWTSDGGHGAGRS